MRTIAYLGPEKTNTHFAALRRFGKRAHYLHAPTIDDVFHFVERRKAEYGVVPVENSLEGAVTHTLDRFADFVDTPVKIHGEIEQPIQHFLILHKETSLTNLRVVCSHPQALAQCRQWLDEHLDHAVKIETHSTAEGVEWLLNEEPVSVHRGHESPYYGLDPQLEGIMPSERAAIARAELAKTKKLRAIPISEGRDNKTRFLVLALGESRRSRRNKTSILFALKDHPGALYDALAPFKRERINLTKIESRPSKKKAWEYYFFIDLEGHVSELRVARALQALERHTALFKVLGSYPVTQS